MRVIASHVCRLSHEGRFLGFSPDRSRVVLAAGDGRYTVADGALRIVHRGTLPTAAGSIAIHPSADLVAVESKVELIISDFSGKVRYRRRHRPWKDWEGGDVEFLGDGSRVLAVCPGDETPFAMLLHWESGEVLAEEAIDVPEESGFHLIRLPNDETLGLWAGAGQDGQWSYWVRLAGDRLAVEEVSALDGKDHGPIELHPSGKEFLVAAEGALERYAFPDVRLLGRIEPPPEDEDFSFGESPCYVGPQRALVTDSQSARLYIVDLASMSVGDEVVVEGPDGQSLGTGLWYLRGLPRAGALTVHGAAIGPQVIALLEGLPLFTPEL